MSIEAPPLNTDIKLSGIKIIFNISPLLKFFSINLHQKRTNNNGKDTNIRRVLT